MDELAELLETAKRDVAVAASIADLSVIETRYLGSKGSLQAQLRSIGSGSPFAPHEGRKPGDAPRIDCPSTEPPAVRGCCFHER